MITRGTYLDPFSNLHKNFLAGGASHRTCVPNIKMKPRQRLSLDIVHPTPLRGSFVCYTLTRWLAPQANFRSPPGLEEETDVFCCDSSGVGGNNQRRCSHASAAYFVAPSSSAMLKISKPIVLVIN